MGYEKVKLEINTYAFDESKPLQRINNNQKIEFSYQAPSKGHVIRMKLTGTPIDAPNIFVCFKINDLKSILEFLIKSEK